MGTRGGERESFRGNGEREKGERLHTRVQSGVRRFGPEGTRKSVTLVKHRISDAFCATTGGGHTWKTKLG